MTLVKKIIPISAFLFLLTGCGAKFPPSPIFPPPQNQFDQEIQDRNSDQKSTDTEEKIKKEDTHEQ